MKPIVFIPNDVLTTPAATVTAFDDKLKKLVSDMKETLIATTNPKGVGLAATQIGVGLRVFVTRPNEKAKIRVFVNPEIVKSSADMTDGVPERSNKLEGCLSIPNVWGYVHRKKEVTLRFQDEKGLSREETFTGFMATIVQHETDHLNGVLYTQRVLEQHEKFFQVVTDEDGKETLEEIHVG